MTNPILEALAVRDKHEQIIINLADMLCGVKSRDTAIDLTSYRCTHKDAEELYNSYTVLVQAALEIYNKKCLEMHSEQCIAKTA